VRPIRRRARRDRRLWRFPGARRRDPTRWTPSAYRKPWRAGERGMNHFPLFADLKGRTVVVIGAGLVAERKIALLRAAGAHVIVNARAAHPQVQARAQTGDIELRLGDFEPTLL